MSASRRPHREGAQWWRDAVVYQIYPRSFQDSDGDGIGDLAGIEARLDHLEWLGVDAIWLSPIYPSPFADCGYDVADYTAVDPLYGDLAGIDRLIGACHERGIRILLDLVASHTSIEHPWFREHPERYVWADGPAPPNNWRSSFGGPAWSRDERSGRFYLHSFYPEQPDLDWRKPDVRAAIGGVIRFWLERGVDGFRVDAVERMVKDRELRDDPPATGTFPLPLDAEHALLEHVRSRNDPEITLALAALREAAGEALLVGEVYLPSDSLGAFLEHLDLVFAFEFQHSPWRAEWLREVIAASTQLDGIAWVLSNHDFPRLASRLGDRAARAAAMLLLTLPGAAFVYQGDEIGMRDGPGAEPPIDRAGRDPHRHPMQWEAEPGGGFSAAEPWLALTDPLSRSVAAQRAEPGSLLALYRELIALRPRLSEGLRLLSPESEPDVLAFERGEHLVALNLGSEPAGWPARRELVLATHPGAESGVLPPGAGVVLRA